MAKTKEQKQKMLDNYKEKLKENPNYFLVNTDKVSMPRITELKMSLEESNSTFVVVKNTLFKIAADETEQPVQTQEIEGPTGVVFCGGEVTQPAKALKELQKEYEVMETKSAVLFGEFADAKKVKQLAEIPSREELLSKLVGSMNSPVSGFMSAVKGNVRQLIFALKDLQKKQAE